MRTTVKDTNGEICGWFDKSKAEKFKEHSDWDGRNWISKCTGSQFEHQILYLTSGGRYIVCTWSQWQGVQDNYTLLTTTEASEWFAKNNYEEDYIPKNLINDVNKLEII